MTLKVSIAPMETTSLFAIQVTLQLTDHLAIRHIFSILILNVSGNTMPTVLRSPQDGIYEKLFFQFKFAAVNDATCTWSGQLPPRCQNNAPLSCKIFLGGVPWDIGEQTLYAAFKPFGNIRYDNLVTSSCTMTPRKHRK